MSSVREGRRDHPNLTIQVGGLRQALEDHPAFQRITIVMDAGLGDLLLASGGGAVTAIAIVLGGGRHRQLIKIFNYTKI